MAEEFEASQEELTSANEELQSTNEEHQSTNEELETAKEELQSSNEELTTVNDELKNRNTDLIALSDDLNNLLSSVEIPILIVENDHHIRRFTPKAESVFKLIASDVGRQLGDIKSSFDLDLDALVTEVTSSLIPMEKAIQDRDGHWVRIQIRPYKTIDKRIDGAVIAVVDIDALKRNEHALRESEKRYRGLFESIDEGFCVIERVQSEPGALLDFRYVEANPAFEVQTGMKGVVGKTIRQLLPGETEEWFVTYDNVCKTGEPIRFELGLTTQGRVLELYAFPVEGENRHRVAVIFKDITERKLAEEKLARESKNVRLYESIAVTANEAKDLETTLQKFLDQICAYSSWPIGHVCLADPYGYGEFVSSKIWHINDPKQFVRFKKGTESLRIARGLGLPGKVFTTRTFVTSCDLDQDLISTKAKLAREAGIKSAMGFPVFVDDSIVAVLEFFSTDSREPDKDLINVITRVVPQLGRVFDREQTKKDRAHLLADAESANIAKDEFMATLSHELRTPLTSILTWSQLIQRQKFDPEKLKHGIKMIEQSALMQGQLIDDLLDLTRIRTGKLSINFTEVNLSEPVNLCIEAVRPLAEIKRIVIETDIKKQTEMIWGDPDRLQQIVWNLLTNAIKFSHEGSLIRVCIEPIKKNDEPFVAITVIDQGKGISAEFLPKLFERFSQAESSSIRVHGGLGLGLAIVRDLVQLLGGTVQATSAGVGKGATFTVLLPIRVETMGLTTGANSTTKKKTQKDIEPADLSELRVMIVEDDPITLEIIREALQSFGAKTHPCTSVDEALAAFEKFNPDVLISDIGMPGEDGLSLIRKIRNLGPKRRGDVPSLALTAFATEGDVKRALEAGFDSHMAKPFDMLRLSRAVAELAKRKQR